MSVVINLYGGPGVGKSTCAAQLFALLKNEGKNVELVQEYAKEWAWSKRQPTAIDQFHFFNKQSRRESLLYNKADYIVTDSPLALCAFYTTIYGSKKQQEIFPLMVAEFNELSNQQHVHIFLNRVKPYNIKGRFQTEEESIDIDKKLLIYLDDVCNITCFHIDGNEMGMKQLVEFLGMSYD